MVSLHLSRKKMFLAFMHGGHDERRGCLHFRVIGGAPVLLDENLPTRLKT
jgi:hypothetical protein